MGADTGVEIIGLLSSCLKHLPELISERISLRLALVIRDSQTNASLLPRRHLQEVVRCHLCAPAVRRNCLLLLLN